MAKDKHRDNPLIPKQPEYGIHSDINEYDPGDSVHEHSDLEAANELIGRGEIGQQNEN
ncbi:MAG: hypothetical protein IMW92_02290 [Bacillales bacterium]|nr:hypothetical protein [Bacillales bacterium]